MMRHLSIRIMALAGICFLLHILVPHHHHADLSSIIEHQRIIECAEGMHDHEANGEEHHHHEELLSESDYTFDDTSYDTVKAVFKAHKLFKMLHAGTFFAFINDNSEYNYTSKKLTEWNYVNHFHDSSIPISHGLRAPPAA